MYLYVPWADWLENSFAEKDVGVLTGKLNGSQQSTSAANKAKSILGCIRKNSQQGDGGGPYPQDKQSHLWSTESSAGLPSVRETWTQWHKSSVEPPRSAMQGQAESWNWSVSRRKGWGKNLICKYLKKMESDSSQDWKNRREQINWILEIPRKGLFCFVFLLWRWTNPGTGYPERLWSPHSWRNSEHNQIWPWAACSEWPVSEQGNWTSRDAPQPQQFCDPEPQAKTEIGFPKGTAAL